MGVVTIDLALNIWWWRLWAWGVMQLKKSEVCISVISSGLFYDKKKKGETQFNVFA